MAKIQISKTVLKKQEYDRVIDSSFQTFVEEPIINTQQAVSDFFEQYRKLYYEIPINGTDNSHEFLITESSKLVQLEKDVTDIQPLLDEINDLRERLLLANQDNLELQTQIAVNGNV